eukprot:gene19152-biopygen3990
MRRRRRRPRVQIEGIAAPQAPPWVKMSKLRRRWRRPNHRVRSSGCTIMLSFPSQATRKGRISATRCSSVLEATVEGAAGARLDVVGTQSQPFIPVRCNRMQRTLGSVSPAVLRAGGTGHWRGHGTGVARAKPFLAWGYVGVARAWRGHVLFSLGGWPRQG